MTVQNPIARATSSGPDVADFRLGNGLEVVVIPDHRAPVVTHMIWYRNGSADDPLGKSGIAHFLEHLMFKGTHKHPQGEFSNVVAELGGQENAFTSTDYTAYFQRVAASTSATVMEFEADRMSGLVLSDEVVDPERDVVIEERRMRTDTDPAAQLGEAVPATLFTHHPYGTPIIGWMHEIEDLGREDALDYYRRFYTPGERHPGGGRRRRARRGAQAGRGDLWPAPREPRRPLRRRPREPDPAPRAASPCPTPRSSSPRCSAPTWCPPTRPARRARPRRWTCSTQILGAQSTGWLHRRLVIEKRVAVMAGGWYQGSALRSLPPGALRRAAPRRDAGGAGTRPRRGRRRDRARRASARRSSPAPRRA